MRKHKLLNSSLVSYLATLGHGDYTCIADAGLPIPEVVTYQIDLALERGLPTLEKMLELVSSEAVFEKVILANELNAEQQQNLITIIKAYLGPKIIIEFVTHEQLKAINQNRTKGIIRTGENTPFYNIILISGVAF